MNLLQASIFGVVEGMTEFLPISSTAHLIIFNKLLGVQGEFSKLFDIFIQFGAILAVVWFYRVKLFTLISGFLKDSKSRSLAIKLAIAFMPTAIFGITTHTLIKTYLFNTTFVCITLTLGGVAILIVESFIDRRDIPPLQSVESLSHLHAFIIGICQSLSLFPGVSRAAATILGAMAVGLSRPKALEFSFLLAIPTMFAASIFDLAKNTNMLNTNHAVILLAGFAVAFISALSIINILIRFIAQHTFKPFGIYRIAVGILMICTL